jgi:hypothetical protein
LHLAQGSPAQLLRVFDDLRDLIDEPRIDRRSGSHPVNGVPFEESALDSEEPVLGRRAEVVEDGAGSGAFGGYEASEASGMSEAPPDGAAPGDPYVRTLDLETPPRLPQRLLEGPADRHDLAHRLHGRREGRVGLGELLEREPRDLHHDVVEGRLEGGRRPRRDVVRDLVKPVPNGEQRGDLGDREPGGLGGEGGRPRHARVHLDQHLAPVAGVDRELDVRAAGLHADRPDAGECLVAHRLVLAIAQGLLWRDGDRITGMHAHRVDVLDRTDDDGVVRAVAHHLELELLPPCDRLLDEDLVRRARVEAPGRERAQLVVLVREARSATAEHERGPDDHRVARLLRDCERLVDGVGDPGPRNRQPGIDHRLLEAAAILGAMDRLEARPEQPHAVPRQGARLGERDGDVQRGLAAQRRQESVGPFTLDHTFDGFGRERLDVRGIGELRIRHDRGRVGVHERDTVPLGAQHLARLRSRIVELARLADHDRAGSDHEDPFDVGARRHQPGPPIRARNSSKR